MAPSRKHDEKLDKLLEFAAKHEERVTNLINTVDEIKTGLGVVGTRVSGLESWRAKAIGITTTASTAAAMALHFLYELLTGGKSQ